MKAPAHKLIRQHIIRLMLENCDQMRHLSFWYFSAAHRILNLDLYGRNKNANNYPDTCEINNANFRRMNIHV